MFSLLKSVASLAVDVVEVAATPVVMAVDLASAAVRPIVDVASDLKGDIKSLMD